MQQCAQRLIPTDPAHYFQRPLQWYSGLQQCGQLLAEGKHMPVGQPIATAGQREPAIRALLPGKGFNGEGDQSALLQLQHHCGLIFTFQQIV